MFQSVGTPSCPHLGFDLQGGRPCCHADDHTRTQCGKFAPNPAAQKSGGQNLTGVEPFFCTVLGKDAIPAEALKLGAQQKAQAAKASRDAGQSPKFRPPSDVQGKLEPLPSREQSGDGDADPIIPTHMLRADEKKVMPNDPCPCGSGRKFKKCCGR
jgi:hypothetical protein